MRPDTQSQFLGVQVAKGNTQCCSTQPLSQGNMCCLHVGQELVFRVK